MVIPPRENIHAAVRLRFLYASHPDAQKIGRWLDDLVRLRNDADYKLASPGRFGDTEDASRAVAGAIDLIDLLDAIESDANRRAAVVATIRP